MTWEWEKWDTLRVARRDAFIPGGSNLTLLGVSVPYSWGCQPQVGGFVYTSRGFCVHKSGVLCPLPLRVKGSYPHASHVPQVIPEGSMRQAFGGRRIPAWADEMWGAAR